MSTIVSLLFFLCMLTFSVLCCFFGRRMIKKLLFFFGLICGAAVGYVLFLPIAATAVLPFLCLGMGLAFAFLFYFLKSLGIFVMGANLGVQCSLIILGVLFVSPLAPVGIALTILFAVAIGFLTLTYKRVFVALSAAFYGASSLVVLGGYALTHLSLFTKGLADPVMKTLQQEILGFYNQHALVLLIVIAVVGALGFFLQMRHGKKNSKKYKKS